jgi:hypothetical protein
LATVTLTALVLLAASKSAVVVVMVAVFVNTVPRGPPLSTPVTVMIPPAPAARSATCQA